MKKIHYSSPTKIIEIIILALVTIGVGLLAVIFGAILPLRVFFAAASNTPQPPMLGIIFTIAIAVTNVGMLWFHFFNQKDYSTTLKIVFSLLIIIGIASCFIGAKEVWKGGFKPLLTSYGLALLNVKMLITLFWPKQFSLRR